MVSSLRALITVSPLLLAASSMPAFAGMLLNGQILDEQQQPLNNARLEINGQSLSVDRQGKFHGEIDEHATYQLTITAPGHYAGRQSFSHYELNQAPYLRGSHGAQLPAITLVKKQPGRVMLAFAGDAMMGRRYFTPHPGEPALLRNDHLIDDTRTLLSQMKPYLSIADYAAVNLETQILAGKPSQHAPKSVTFYSPPETLQALTWAGVDYVDLGNNHTFDYLEEGLTETLKHLDASSLAYSGAGHSEQEALKAHRQTLGQNPLSFLGYVGWRGSFTPHQVAEGDKGGAAFGSMKNIRQSVAREAGAGYTTIVQYHGSQEYSEGPTGVTESRLKAAVDEGADLVIGHHPHVPQGFELYNGKLIAYSMGNFLFDQYFFATPQSFMLYVWMDGETFHRAEIVPIYLKGYVPTPATGIQRFSVMKRLARLSGANGVEIDVSGGHGIIYSNGQRRAKTVTRQSIALAAQQTPQSLYHTGWDNQLQSFVEATLPRHRLGENLVHGGDFESFNTFDALERSWLLEGGQLSSEQAASGRQSLKFEVTEGKPALFAMSKFRRIYRRSNPASWSARLKTTQPVEIRLYMQQRTRGKKLLDALSNAPKQLIASRWLSGSNNWQNLSVPFNTPRNSYNRFRLLMEIHTDGQQAPVEVFIDDAALIQWLTPYQSSNVIDEQEQRRATHLQFESAPKEKVSLLLR